jgi:hypothetical protein
LKPKRIDVAIDFVDSSELRVRFYSLIIDVAKINRAYGSVTDFAAEYDLTGTTNGELLVLYFMSYPGSYYDGLIGSVFEPNGLTYREDYVLIEEELAFGVRDQPSPGIGKPLSSLYDIGWLESVLREDGNWVWK